jgi:HEAT repeat protein
MEDLSNPSSTARMRAAHAVGQIVPEGRKAIPILIRLLDDKAHLVRWAAASSLERFGTDSRDALPALEKLAKNDPEPSVRDAAGSAVRSIRMVVEHLGAGR